jgi:hypothetical protein
MQYCCIILSKLVGRQRCTLSNLVFRLLLFTPPLLIIRVAYTYTGGCSRTNCGWLAVINQNYCKSASALTHEIAHNMGFQHSGMVITGTRLDQYRDKTGLMGFSSGNDDTYMCFNPPKSFQTEWYKSRDVKLDSTNILLTDATIKNPWTADLIGVADYGNASGEQKVTIQLDDATSPYYIGFNRKTGIQVDSQGPPDRVTVSTQNTKTGQSWLLAYLDAGQFYDIANYLGTGKDVRIQVLGYTTEEPRVAQIEMYPLPTFCPGDITLAGQIGSTNYDSIPITIISQDTTSITIEVSNTWGEDVLSNMFTRYDDSRLESTCHELTQVTKTDTSRYTIACMVEDPVAHVDIFVTDNSFSADLDDAAVPQCCHPEAAVVAPSKTVQYIFMLQCVSQCPAEGIQRQLLRGSTKEEKGN